GVTESIEVRANREEWIEGFGTGDDVEIPPFRHHQVGAGKVFEVWPDLAHWPADALGNDPQLAVTGREDRQDTIGLAEIHAAEDDRFGSVDALAIAGWQ